MSNHTPGDWRYCDQTGYIFGENGQMTVGEVRGWGYFTGIGGLNLSSEEARKIQNSNGELMADAPKLLKALIDGTDREALIEKYK